MTEEQKTKEQDSIEASVMKHIESERVIPKWQFLLSEYGIWILWAFSVLFGAIAFSVILFFFMHAGVLFSEVVYESKLRYFLDILPYAWVIIFILMATLAHYNLRRTKRGYKYEVWRVLLSSIVCSFVLGLILHIVGMGFIVDRFVARSIPLFPALDRIEHNLWQAPLHGRMVGNFVREGEQKDVVFFKDDEGMTWELNVRELSPLDLGILYEGDKVRVIGISSTTRNTGFHGCAVMPWLLNKPVTFRDMERERQQFIERMEMHHNLVMEKFNATGSPLTVIEKPLCGEHAAVMRVWKRNQ